MRRLALTCSFLGSLITAGCVPPNGSDSTEDRASEAKAPIVYGTADTTHTAVVALLTNETGGYLSSCTGTVVKMSGTTAYVLTAAHCCNARSPTIAVLHNDYGNYEQWVFGGNPPAPAYKVDQTSVYYDSAYNGTTHDFCMLKVPGVPASTPSIPVAQPNQDGVQIGTQLEHVGFGQTQQDAQNPNNPNQNTGRRHGINTANVSVTNQAIQYTQGGPNLNSGTPGPCHGDSGGPALVPAGAAQSAQKVVGVTSYGTGSGECIGSGAEGVSVRVTSVTGANGFITNYLNDTPTGSPGGTASSGTCDDCQSESLSPGGACSSTYNACTSNTKCNTLLDCFANCQSQTCANNCWTAAGTTGQNLYNAIINCVCDTGCTTECTSQCGGSSSSSSSSSSGSMGCGLQSSNAACNTCLTSKCCSQASACAASTTCLDCVTDSTPPASCNSNAQANALSTCLSNNCATQCGIASSSSSSSGSMTSSSSSSGSASSSSSSSASSAASSGMIGVGGGNVGGGNVGGGTGTGAAGNTDGTGGSGGNDTNQDSGCNVSGNGTGSTPSNGSLVGLLIGAAVAIARRRRSA